MRIELNSTRQYQGNTRLTDIRAALRGGYNAYYAAFSTGYFGADHRPQRTTNPHTQNPIRDLWLRGWREAEKAFSLGQYLQRDPFEAVRGMREAARYLETKARAKNRKHQESDKQDKRPAHQPHRQTNIVNPVFAAPYGKAQPVVKSINLKRLNKFNKKYRTVV